MTLSDLRAYFDEDGSDESFNVGDRDPTGRIRRYTLLRIPSNANDDEALEDQITLVSAILERLGSRAPSGIKDITITLNLAVFFDTAMCSVTFSADVIAAIGNIDIPFELEISVYPVASESQQPNSCDGLAQA